MELFKILGTIAVKYDDAVDDLNKVRNEAKKTSSGLDDVDDSAKKTAKGGFTILKGAIANLVAQGFAKLGNAIGTFIADGVDYYKSIEQYSTSFETMTGSAEKAAEMTQRLQEIGASTPFELPQLADTTQLLMNYGFTADDAIDKMTMLGDISQGNADKMSRIAAAYGQMSSAGKVSLEDIKQMIEAGFNPLQEISDATGESMESLYERISKGTISIDEITASMERSTSEGGKYFGAMDAQSQTLAGRLSTLKDTANELMNTALAPVLQKAANEWLPALTDVIAKGIDGGATVLISGLITMSQNAIEALVASLPEIMSAIVDVIPMLLNGIATIGQALVAALPPIVMAIANFISDPANVQMIAETGITLLMSLIEIIPEIGIQLIQMAPQLIYALIQGLWNAAETLFLSVFNLGKGVVNKFKEVFGIGDGGSSVMQEQGTALAKGIETGMEGLPEAADATFSAMNSNITTNMAATRDQVSADFAQIGNDMSNVSIGAGDGVAQSFGAMRDTVSGSMTSTSSEVTSKAQEIKTTMDSQLTATQTIVSDKFQLMQQTMTSALQTMVSTVQSEVEKIKEAFNVELKFKSVVVPKFRLSGKFDAENGKVPTVTADPKTIYFAEGGIVDQATIFGMLGNRPMVAGEAGKEAIAPIDTLQGYVSQAVASQNAGLIDALDRILVAIVNMDENMGENMKDALDGTGLTINKREFGRMVRGVLA